MKFTFSFLASTRLLKRCVYHKSKRLPPESQYHAHARALVSLNLHRRHLNESQRAMVAAKLATMVEGRPSETRPIGLVSQDNAAEMLNVSTRSVKRAKAVQESGDASLIADVESGEVTVSAAAKHVAAVQRYPRKQKRPARKPAS